LSAALCTLLIPRTNIDYPPQQTNPILLLKEFRTYVHILWRDKLGQISLAVTTLFWGAGATLQSIVIGWGAQHLGYRLGQAYRLPGLAALGTGVGAGFAARVRVRKSVAVLPVGVAMGFAVLLTPWLHEKWAVYSLLL